MILVYVKLLVFVNLGLLGLPHPARARLQIYFFLMNIENMLVLILQVENVPWWAVSTRCFRTHPVHSLFPRLQVPAWHVTKSDESMPTCCCNRGQSLRSTARGQLDVTHLKTSMYGRRAFSFASPSAWNALPNYLKDSSVTFVMFKRSLKTFCFQVLAHRVH